MADTAKSREAYELWYFSTDKYDEYLISFLAATSEVVSDTLIDHHPNLDVEDVQKLKDQVAKKRSEFAKEYPKFESSLHDIYGEEEDLNIYKNAFKDLGSYKAVQRRTKAVKAMSGIPIDMLPGWPPLRKASTGEGEAAAGTKDSDSSGTSSAGGERREYDPESGYVIFNMPKYPDNIPSATSNTVIKVLKALDKKAINPDDYSLYNSFLKNHGLSFSEDRSYLFWSDINMMYKAEEEFVTVNKRFSDTYSNYRSREKFSKTKRDEEMDSLLAKLAKPESDANSDGARKEKERIVEAELRYIWDNGVSSKEYMAMRSQEGYVADDLDAKVDALLADTEARKYYGKIREYIRTYKALDPEYEKLVKSADYKRTRYDDEIDAYLKEFLTTESAKVDKASSDLDGILTRIREGRIGGTIAYSHMDASSWKAQAPASSRSAVGAIFNLDYLPRLEVTADRFILRPSAFTVDAAVRFIKDNELDDTSTRDCILATIMVYLLSVEGIEPNADRFEDKKDDSSSSSAGKAPIRPSSTSPLKESKMEVWKREARNLLKAAFYYQSQGAGSDGVRWFRSYQAVFGDFISENNFNALMKILINSAAMAQLPYNLTLKEIISDNNVLTYRLTRISSPQLVYTAMSAITGTAAAGFIDVKALVKYCEFYKAGLPAQIASGPLKNYCKGRLDPLKAADYPEGAVVADLAPIESAPYDERILKQTMIILDKYGIPRGNWYQGMKAMATKDKKDIFFEQLVAKVRDKQVEHAESYIQKLTDIGRPETVFKSDEKAAEVLESLMSTWKDKEK